MGFLCTLFGIAIHQSGKQGLAKRVKTLVESERRLWNAIEKKYALSIIKTENCVNPRPIDPSYSTTTTTQ
jgi:hypothetical protein